MSDKTAAAPETQARRTRGNPPSGAGAVAMPVPPKQRRRPLLLLAGILALALGALGGYYALTTVASTKRVVAVRHDIPRGAVIGQDDLVVTTINGDTQLDTVPGNQLDGLVGKRATRDLNAGGLVAPAAVGEEPIPPKDQALVGVSLTPAQRPASTLLPGTSVRVVSTPGNQANGANNPAVLPLSLPAKVVTVGQAGANGEVTVDVLVPAKDAATLASRAATGNIALVVDSEAH